MITLRQSIRYLRGTPATKGGNTNNTLAEIIPFQQSAFAHSQLIVKMFYLFLAFIGINATVGRSASWVDGEALRPLWPVAWFDLVGAEYAGWFIVLLCFLLFAVGLFWVEHSWARAGMFVAFFQIAALNNSFGKINHGLHGLIIISFVLIFFPKISRLGETSIAKRQRALLVFAFAQIMFMLFYSMSGVWKVYAGIDQSLFMGHTYHTFHPDALALQVAHRLVQTNSESILGGLIVQYPILGFAPYLAAIYLETFALVAAFRPSLHRIWGISMIMFHMGTWLTMTISFNVNIVLLGLFFVYSPFASHHDWKVSLRQLPLLGFPLSWLLRRAGFAASI